MKWLGTRLGRQGTRASSSDSTAGSELHGRLRLRQVLTYKTLQSPMQATASQGPPLLPLKLSGATPVLSCLEGCLRDGQRGRGRVDQRWWP